MIESAPDQNSTDKTITDKTITDKTTTDKAATPPTARPGPDFWQAALTLLPYVLLLATAFSVFAQSVDDPFITFRYARNMLAGLGPVFNPGERVEGFTSPLHLLLTALLLKILPGVGALFKAKLASLLFALVLLWQVRPLAREFGLSPTQGVLAQCLIALNVNFAVPAVNGLETTLYAVLLTAGVHRFLVECREEAAGQKPRLGSALWLVAALVARPDTLLSFGTLLCVLLWRLRRGETTIPRVASWAVVFLVPLGAMTLVRLSYFGEPLPNTYYAKHSTLAFSIPHGISYLLRPMTPIGTETHVMPRRGGTFDSYFLLPQMLWYWGLFALGLTRLRSLKFSLVLFAELAAMLALVLRAGGDWMLGWRFILPFSPYLTFIQCLGLVAAGDLLTRALRARPQRGYGAAVAATGLFWLASALANPHFSWSATGFSTNDRDLLAPSMYGRIWVAAADYIQVHVPQGGTVAGSEMGYAPYVNMDKHFFDVRGLTNAEVALGTPSAKKDYAGVHDRRWFLSDSLVGSRILKLSPSLIYIVIDNAKKPLILDGRYKKTLISDDMQARIKACKTSVNFYVPVTPPPQP